MKDTQKLTVKDLVNVGIFSALYMVLTLIIMIPAGFAPILWLLWPCMAGIVGGVFFTLLMLLMMITALIGGASGTLIGRAMMKKHFQKAGIV